MRNTGEEAKRRLKNGLNTGGGISEMPLWGKNMAPFDAAPRKSKDTYRVLRAWKGLAAKKTGMV